MGVQLHGRESERESVTRWITGSGKSPASSSVLPRAPRKLLMIAMQFAQQQAGPDVEGVGAAEVMGALEQMFGLDPTNGEDSDEGEGEEGDES